PLGPAVGAVAERAVAEPPRRRHRAEQGRGVPPRDRAVGPPRNSGARTHGHRDRSGHRGRRAHVEGVRSMSAETSLAVALALASTAAAAVAAVAIGRRVGAIAVSEGIAGGLFFSIGDISVKVATEGGARAAFGITVVLGYGLGTALLQLGYQHGGALTVAG